MDDAILIDAPVGQQRRVGERLVGDDPALGRAEYRRADAKFVGGNRLLPHLDRPVAFVGDRDRGPRHGDRVVAKAEIGLPRPARGDGANVEEASRADRDRHLTAARQPVDAGKIIFVGARPVEPDRIGVDSRLGRRKQVGRQFQHRPVGFEHQVLQRPNLAIDRAEQRQVQRPRAKQVERFADH
ncbi:hypothetical protein H9L12_12330 [Sphingomonas rhizophila]|uniref:Uncharacterized protein n=1 Tax=Sphingomonas rhizophila TaxID=2071607 RepID=A0A7G9SAU5_9SPHN|nr:hypothetical protein H9L12_12330 [Sphingomonas rhizophila]